MDLKIVQIILMILYSLICLFYAYEKRRNQANVQEICFVLLICFLVPVFGFLFLNIIDYVSNRSGSKDYSAIYRGERYCKDELFLLRALDYGAEVNQIPIEDSLKLNEYEHRRKVIMNTLKDEKAEEYIRVLKEALENEDSETSHYASTVIMQLRQKIQEAVIQKEKLYEDTPGILEYAISLEEELYRVIESEVYEKENIYKYYLLYEKISDQLLKQDKPEEKFFFHRIHVNFRQKKYTQMKDLCIHYMQTYPESEDAILSTIELCILTKDGAFLDEFLKVLPNIPVRLTQKTMGYIRFFRAERNLV